LAFGSSPLDDTGLLAAVRRIWEGARIHAARTVNSALVQANWLIGRQIVEAQQGGKDRAGWGEELLAGLSKALPAEYGAGFSVTGLQYMRALYQAYPALVPIRHSVRVKTTSKAISEETNFRHALRVESEGSSDWKPGMLHPSLTLCSRNPS